MNAQRQELLRTLVNMSKTATVALVAGAVLAVPLALRGCEMYWAGTVGLAFISLAHIVSRAGPRGVGVLKTGADIFDAAIRRVRDFAVSDTKVKAK